VPFAFSCIKLQVIIIFVLRYYFNLEIDMNGSSNVEMGWFDKLKNSLQLDAIAQKLNLSKQKFFEIAFFLGIGFLIGFFWKRYANYVIAGVIFITILILLHKLDLVTVAINWTRIQECCGITPVIPEADLVGTLWEWAKLNVLVIVSFIIGFCFGAKMS
jgi:hypothetical protein